MAISQKRFFHKTKFNSSKIKQLKKRRIVFRGFLKGLEKSFKLGHFQKKFLVFYRKKALKNKGFISVLILPFISLIMTAMFGLFSLSVGIRNITQVQSYCIKINLKGQTELAVLLNKLMRLNKKVQYLSQTRGALNTALLAAIAGGRVELIPQLKQKIELIKKAQIFLILNQKRILSQSLVVKTNTFRRLKKEFQSLPVSYVHKKIFYKSALAVQKHKIGDRAYIYKPVPDFINHQKTGFSWTLKSFSPLNNFLNLEADSQYSQQSCTASLKQKGNKWISTLYH